MTEDSKQIQTTLLARNPLLPWMLGLPLACILWVAAYVHLIDMADLAVSVMGLSRGTHFGEAVHFFIYDTPKVLLLLVGYLFNFVLS